jgi:hypothetical protein
MRGPKPHNQNRSLGVQWAYPPVGNFNAIRFDNLHGMLI